MKYPILVPNIFNHPFTYESSLKLKVGDYVMVPFGKSKITGVVWDEFEKNNNKNFKTKNIIKKLDVTPLKKNTINFLNWFAEYNLIPKGMALKLVLLTSNAVENKEAQLYQIFYKVDFLYSLLHYYLKALILMPCPLGQDYNLQTNSKSLLYFFLKG